jgi:hypothetical protein
LIPPVVVDDDAGIVSKLKGPPEASDGPWPFTNTFKENSPLSVPPVSVKK